MCLGLGIQSWALCVNLGMTTTLLCSLDRANLAGHLQWLGVSQEGAGLIKVDRANQVVGKYLGFQVGLHVDFEPWRQMPLPSGFIVTSLVQG